MKIQDIRIGSYIRGYYDEGNERKYRDFKVVNILGNLEEVESEEGEIFHIDDCDGIPLTEEFFKRNGLKLGKTIIDNSGHLSFPDPTRIHINRMEVIIDGISIYHWKVSLAHHETYIADGGYVTGLTMHHVHEFQHALYTVGLYDIAEQLKLPENDQESKRPKAPGEG